MAKKNVDDAVAALLGGQQGQQETIRVKRDARSRSRAALSSVIDSNTAGYEAVTMLVNTDYYDKIKEIAFTENLTIKKVVEQAMSMAIKLYESTHGEIKLRKIKQGKTTELFSAV